MFSNFTNIPTSYDPSVFEPNQFGNQLNKPCQSIITNKPYEILSDDGILKGYFWYYGNSVDLEFELAGEVTLLDSDQYITFEELINHLDIKLYVYDFRMEPIMYFSTDLGAEYPLIIDSKNKLLKAQITNQMSKKLIKGKYFLDLIATHPCGYHETLFNADSCVFEVR